VNVFARAESLIAVCCIECSWCLAATMGANIAGFSQGQSSFNFGKRKRQNKAGMFNHFLNDFFLHIYQKMTLLSKY
jgi:hypothetical protein